MTLGLISCRRETGDATVSSGAEHIHEVKEVGEIDAPVLVEVETAIVATEGVRKQEEIDIPIAPSGPSAPPGQEVLRSTVTNSGMGSNTSSVVIPLPNGNSPVTIRRGSSP